MPASVRECRLSVYGLQDLRPEMGIRVVRDGRRWPKRYHATVTPPEGSWSTKRPVGRQQLNWKLRNITHSTDFSGPRQRCRLPSTNGEGPDESERVALARGPVLRNDARASVRECHPSPSRVRVRLLPLLDPM